MKLERLTHLGYRRPAWHDDALCATKGAPTDWDANNSQAHAVQTREIVKAVGICHGCSVVTDCAKETLTQGKQVHGVIKAGVSLGAKWYASRIYTSHAMRLIAGGMAPAAAVMVAAAGRERVEVSAVGVAPYLPAHGPVPLPTAPGAPTPPRAPLPPVGRSWGGRRVQRLTAMTLAHYGTICHLCEHPGANTADHIVPRYHGGHDGLDNLRPAHKGCNSRRGAMFLHEYFQRYPIKKAKADPSRDW